MMYGVVQLLYGGGSARMMSPAFLNPLLQSALDSSLHGDSPNTQLLSFAVVDSAAPSHPHGNHTHPPFPLLTYLSLF